MNTEPPLSPDDDHDVALIRMSDHLAAVCQRPAGHPGRTSAISRLALAIAAIAAEAPPARS
jgi:hypothetical protein